MKQLKPCGCILLSFFLVTVLLSSSASASKRIALVIGNGAYKSSPLKNPVNDASDIRTVLELVGFDVILTTNADKGNMLKAIDEFSQRLKQSKAGLFYFAGHGMQIKGSNYLIPIDAHITSETDVEYAAVNAGRVLGKMEDAGNRMNIVILDACRDNPFKRSFRTSQKGLARMEAPVGSIVAYATSPGSVAEDGAGRNGIYTKNLLKVIPQQGVALHDIFMEVRKRVLKETGGKQIPWEESSIVGKFYFLEGKSSVIPEQQAKTAPSDQKPVKKTVISNTGDMDLDVLLAMAKKKKDEKEHSKNQELARKKELAELIKKYETLINNYGDTYKKEAWNAICAEFPFLTADIKLGDISGLKIIAGLLEGGDVWTEPVTGMEFVWVPCGCYQMGQTEAEKRYLIKERGEEKYNKYYKDELPRHEICVDGFWIGRYEVTQGQWKKIMGNNPSNHKNGDNYPVETVHWYDTKLFIEKLNHRNDRQYRFALPSEAQWEYAARSGGRAEAYSGGNNVDQFAWYSSNSGDKKHRVGTKAPNGLGIYDMSGNVSEWCEDIYAEYAYSKHQRNNPVYAGSGSLRVLRGGGWLNTPASVRCTYRAGDTPGNADNVLGFRLVRTNYPEIRDSGGLKMTTFDISARFVENEHTGRFFVITGKVKNGYPDARSYITIMGKLYSKGKNLEKVQTAFCGNLLTNTELARLDIEAIKNRLSNRLGDNRSNFDVAPGKILPFMLVFTELPEGLEEYTIEVVGSTAQ